MEVSLETSMMYATKVYIVGDGLCIRKERHVNFSKAKIVNEKLGD